MTAGAGLWMTGGSLVGKLDPMTGAIVPRGQAFGNRALGSSSSAEDDLAGMDEGGDEDKIAAWLDPDRHGVDLEALIEVGRMAERLVGHPLPSTLLRSGSYQQCRASSLQSA